MAKRIGKNFPEHILDVDDLTQEGWISLLGCSEEYRDNYQNPVALRAMIDAMRRFRETPRWNRFDVRGARKLEVLVEDIELLFNDQQYEYWLDDAIDMKSALRELSLREKVVFYSLANGETLLSIGEILGITEGRVCQIRRQILDFLNNKLNQEEMNG